MTADALPRRYDRVWLRAGWHLGADPRAFSFSPSGGEGGGEGAQSSGTLDTVVAWVARGRPLVAARRDPARPGDVALGLVLPLAEGRGRIGVVVPPDAVARAAAPWTLAAALCAAPAAWRPRLSALDAAARRAGLVLRVHGSLAWQRETGDGYLTDRSDVDLLVRPRDAASLASALGLLASSGGAPRLDGEVLLPGGRAVAWRELLGGARSVLVRNDLGAALEPRSRVLALLAREAA